MNFKIKIEDLKEVVYYIYITSNLTGDFPLARSRGIRIRHEPVVSHIGDFLSDDSDYLDSGKLFDLDTGERGPVSKSRDSVRISFNAVDFNDTATVKLYYALTDNLELADLVTSGTSPNEVVNTLKGAVLSILQQYFWKVGILVSCGISQNRILSMCLRVITISMV